MVAGPSKRLDPKAGTPMEKGGRMIEIYTDGACSGNPGPGRWGALLHMSQVEKRDGVRNRSRRAAELPPPLSR
jgi:RNase H-like protein